MGDDPIPGEKSDSFDHRLGNQEAIEGVSMYQGKRFDGDGMRTLNRKLQITVFEQALSDRARVICESAALLGSLDRNLPKICRAEEECICRIIEDGSADSADTVIVSQL